MINSNQSDQCELLQSRDSITIIIDGEEDHTVIQNPPGFPTDEELKLIGIGDKMLNVEIDESDEPDG